MNHTLVILDWDDTLFPTTWTINNDIDISNQKVREKYQVVFAELDNILYELFDKTIKYGKIIIVSNASAYWVKLSLKMLPNTNRLVQNNILILSARDLHQNNHSINVWKDLTFFNIVNSFKNFDNIISIGDAEYEYRALINLYDSNNHRNKI